MMQRYSVQSGRRSDAIEAAVIKALDEGYRTGDFPGTSNDKEILGTVERQTRYFLSASTKTENRYVRIWRFFK
jgi:isocitrate/isopropylmalate dehydrogenase